MTEGDGAKKSMKEELLDSSNEPVTLKDRIVGIVIAMASIAFGACTWLWPQLVSGSSADPSGRGGKKVLFLLELLWSRAVGSIGILLGIAAIFGVLTKKGTSDAPQ